ncbi:peptide chain release factor H [Entomohabitans teleogrylli]|uniref:peptide chain release factor H n=1 Tax=Entomohabitans teleogrylli TaxID=1384589 RepID=UPI00073D5ADB|nr:peptide chain release factor H [Entomohabitans teleogrylli]
MILLQLSSAQGPDECCLAVSKALARLSLEARTHGVAITVLEELPGRVSGTLRSALVVLEGAKAQYLAEVWCGSLLWVCKSPYRPGSQRKNWFIGAAAFSPAAEGPDGTIRFDTLRASGPGGQHVNKTESAIRATHVESGISVRVQSERSQHANKRLALMLIAHRLEQHRQEQQAALKAQRRLFHHQIERGNPQRIFHGEGFTPVK